MDRNYHAEHVFLVVRHSSHEGEMDKVVAVFAERPLARTYINKISTEEDEFYGRYGIQTFTLRVK